MKSSYYLSIVVKNSKEITKVIGKEIRKAKRDLKRMETMSKVRKILF